MPGEDLRCSGSASLLGEGGGVLLLARAPAAASRWISGAEVAGRRSRVGVYGSLIGSECLGSDAGWVLS